MPSHKVFRAERVRAHLHALPFCCRLPRRVAACFLSGLRGTPCEQCVAGSVAKLTF